MSFWVPDYFGAVNPQPTVDPTDPPGLTDVAAVEWVYSTLEASGLFTSVKCGPYQSAGAQDYPSAWIYPVSFEERDDAEEFKLRSLTYAVRISVNAAEPGDPFAALRELDQLVNGVGNLISAGAPDGSIPALSRLLKGYYQTSGFSPIGGGVTTKDAWPALSCTLQATIAYDVPGDGGRNPYPS